MVWASPLSIATTQGITIVLFSSAYLDVSVQRVCLPYNGITHSHVLGCPIRTSADQGIFAPPRSFSQLITSFFASESLGILRTPLLTSLFFLALSYSCIFIQNTIIYRYITASLYTLLFSLVQYVKDLIHVTVQC